MKYLKNVFLLQTIFFTFCLLFFSVASVEAKIVFRMGDDICVMNDDGTNRRRLTRNTVSKDHYPRWSPDGKRIAFIRFMDKKRTQTSGELFIMNANGKHLQRLTDDNVGDGYPSWSPDGKKIAFRTRRSGDSEVHVIDLATRNITQLTGLTGAENERGSTAPDWSSDGTQIVYEKFISNRKPNGGGFAAGFAHKNIYLMSADGEDQRPLLPDPKPGAKTITMRFFPRWSADGQRILFYEAQCRIFVQRIGGVAHAIKDIYERLGDNLLTAGACWMDNDRAVLFGLKLTDKPNASYDLYRYEFRTRKLRRLTRDPQDEKWPDWIEGALSVSPQGKLPTQWGEKKQNISQ
ncbi:PD40 domain-containing protein [Candidatus Poribacteria bacterium]|nr:PD40 domain-containing protein [Candidatus Poribacteria bacterium]